MHPIGASPSDFGTQGSGFQVGGSWGSAGAVDSIHHLSDRHARYCHHPVRLACNALSAIYINTERFGVLRDFTPSLSEFTNLLTLLTSCGDLPCCAIWFTTALPTTTASAQEATCFACSGLEMPKPTAMGRFVCARILPVICARSAATFSCIPVTPSREM